MSSAPTRLEIRLLGGFGASVDGVAVGDWPGLRAAQLVQLLALADGHRLLREQVIDALWPRLGPAAGAANLRKAAHHARLALRHPDAVRLQGGRVMLGASMRIEVDARRFAQQAERALASGDAAACADAAVAYTAELLPEARYEPWAEAARSRLHLLHLDLLRAGGQWERLAQAEPTDEPAHRELMRRELAAGNRAAALRWYFRLRDALQRTLGVRPDASTEALFEACAGVLRGAPAPALVGRHDELAQATAWLAAAHDGQAGGIAVCGEAGVGKSALCRQLAALAGEKGWTVVLVDAAPTAAAYAAARVAVEQLLADDTSLAQRVGAPARSVLAALSALAGPAAPPAGPMGRHQVIGALRRLLLARSGGAPALLVVDDAHQLGDADADVLLQLATTGRPVHVVAALRSPPPSARRPRSRLLDGRHLRVLELGPLDDAHVARIVTRAVPAPLGEATVGRVVRLAQGNPFVALELARSATGASWPATVRDAVAARLCDVDEGTMALLHRLALLDDAFDTATAVALGDGDETQAFARLDAALDAGVLVVTGMRYRFAHDLVRDALCEQVAPHRRLALHREVARCLAAIDAAPAAVARQWLAGGSVAEAVPWLLAAAQAAARLGAFRDALRHLEPVLQRDPAHAEALRLRAQALDAVGDPTAAAAYELAAATAGGPAAHDLRAMGALARIKQGDPKGALQSLVGVRPASVEGRLSEALAYSGAAALGFADPAIGTRKAAQARRLALNSGDTAAIVVASWAQAAAAHARGELHGSVWADLLDTRDAPQLAVRVFDGHLCITQRFLYGARPYPQVIAFADAIAAQAQRLGAARGHAFGVTLRGEAELLAGDLDAAQEHLAIGARLHRAIGAPVGEALALQRQAELALHRGRRDEAAALLDDALDLARQTDIGFHLLDRIYGTRVAMCADADEALAVLDDAHDAVRGPLETCPGCRITFAVPAAIAAARARRLDLAETHATSCEYLANVVMRLPAWHAALHEVHAHVARAQGGDACARFAAAAWMFRAAGHRLDALRCERLAATAR